MTRALPRDPRRRLAPLDGLRGAAIVLVVLSHGWALWPTKGIEASPLVGLFRAGNLAVTIFFLVGGFLLTRSLLRQVDERGAVGARTAILRRFARISAHVYPLVVAILVVHALDDTDNYNGTNLRQSVLRIVTYTWNWFLRDSPLLARPDLGHLWFVCVYLQVTILLVVVVKLLGRRRVLLVALLGLTTIALILWRGWVVDHESLYSALLRTTTRTDGMIWGALLAAALPWIRAGATRIAPFLLPVSLGALVVLLLTTGHDETYFGWQGVLMNVAVVGFVAAVVHLDHRSAVEAALAWRPLVRLGAASMAIFVWHYPIFWAVSRHTTSWAWYSRTVVALAVTAVFVLLAQRFVERPLQAWLTHPRWDQQPQEAGATPDGATRDGLAGEPDPEPGHGDQHHAEPGTTESVHGEREGADVEGADVEGPAAVTPAGRDHAEA